MRVKLSSLMSLMRNNDKTYDFEMQNYYNSFI